MDTFNRNLRTDLRRLRDEKSWPQMIKIGKDFLSNISDQQLISKYSLKELIYIYDELLIGSWYGNDKELSRQFANRINNLLNKVYIEDDAKIHYLENLSYHGIKHVPDLSIGEICVFTNDNSAVINLPVCNDSLCRFASEYKNRDKHEVIFRQICTYLIKNRYIQNNIIDLGAWIGDNSIPWAKNIFGIVYAIDPSRKNCEYIRTIAKLNNVKNVEVIQTAISNVEETLSTNDDIDHCAFNSNSKGNVKVKSTTLDNLHQKGLRIAGNAKLSGAIAPGFTRKIKNIEFIHLDVEGMEWSVIQGSRKIISKYKPIICFEQHINTDNYQVIVNYLKSMDYRIYLINEQSGGRVDCRNFISFPSKDSDGHLTGIPLIVPLLQKHLFFNNCGDQYGGELNILFGPDDAKIFGSNNKHLTNLGGTKIGDIGKIIFENGKLVAYINGKKKLEVKAKSCHYHGIISIYDSKVSLNNVRLYEGDAFHQSLWFMKNIILSEKLTFAKSNQIIGYNSRMVSLSLTNFIEIKISTIGGHFRFGLIPGQSKSANYLTEY